jgi:putative hydrolase of the HAD superfamily
MLPYDTILFDVGGVLLTNGWDHNERAAAMQAFQLDKEDFEGRHAEIFESWERGEITMDAYLDFTVFHQPRSFSSDNFAAFIMGQSRILPNGALDLLKELAASGKFLVGALNNEARETNEYRFQTFGLRNYFDLALSSCYLGLRKPAHAIYSRAVDIVGSKPERILFIDDREENITPAKAVGMAAIHFQGANKLRQEFGSLDVL